MALPARLAESDPRTFCMLLAKLIPHELKLEGSDDGVPLVVVRDFSGGRGGLLRRGDG